MSKSFVLKTQTSTQIWKSQFSPDKSGEKFL